MTISKFWLHYIFVKLYVTKCIGLVTRPGVEFPSLVDVLAACGAPHVTWGHQTDNEGAVPTLGSPRDLGRVEVRWVVFVQNLSLRHGSFSVTVSSNQ